jgi:hypothetical protein
MAVDTSQNGENTMNGAKVTASRHASNGREKAPQEGREKLASQAKPKPTPRKVMPTKSDKEGVANALERCAQIVQATIKPAPNQEGPGPVNEPRKWGKLKQDLKTLRSAGTCSLGALFILFEQADSAHRYQNAEAGRPCPREGREAH